MITKETIDAILAGAKSFTEVTSGLASDLIAEALNLYIFLGILSVLKFMSVFIIYFILRKYVNALPEEYATFKKSANALLITSSLIFFVVKSFPHLEDIAKATVAPKIFLIQKGSELLKR